MEDIESCHDHARGLARRQVDVPTPMLTLWTASVRPCPRPRSRTKAGGCAHAHAHAVDQQQLVFC